jgi:hypothetical protein
MRAAHGPSQRSSRMTGVSGGSLDGMGMWMVILVSV